MTTNLLASAIPGSLIRISTSSSGQQGDGGSYHPVFSGDGLRVAFESDATNLVTGDTNGASDVFAKDLTTDVLTRGSTGTAGEQLSSLSTVAGSADEMVSVRPAVRPGGYLGGPAEGSGLGGAHAPLRRIRRVASGRIGLSRLVGRHGHRLRQQCPHAARAGRGAVRRGSLHDAAAGTLVRLDGTGTGALPNGGSFPHAFSPSGKRVALHRFASDLVAGGDSSGVADILLRTLLQSLPMLSARGRLAPVSEGQSGTEPATFTVTRTPDATGSASVAWTVTGSTANPANEGNFAGSTLPAGMVDFVAAETATSISVLLTGDCMREGDEGFAAAFSNPIGGTLGTSTATTIIRNDDLPARWDLNGGGASDIFGRGAGGEVITWLIGGGGGVGTKVLADPGTSTGR